MAAVDWYISTLAKDIQLLSLQSGTHRYELLFDDAKLSATGLEGLYFFPFIRGIIEDPQMTGAFIGIQNGHTTGDFVVALIEGLGYEFQVHSLAWVRHHDTS